jgi:hypothetical protein
VARARRPFVFLTPHTHHESSSPALVLNTPLVDWVERWGGSVFVRWARSRLSPKGLYRLARGDSNCPLCAHSI